MSVLRDIKLARETELNTREPVRVSFPAIIVKVGESIHPTNRSNYVWVYEQNKPSNILAVLNMKVSPVKGLSVLVAEVLGEDKELEIVGLYTAQLDQNSESGANFNLPLHSVNHLYRTETEIGIDPLITYAPSIGILKCTDNNNLTVNILEYRFIYNSISYYFTGETVDLTTYVPITPNRKIVLLLYLDAISNTIQILSGIETNTILPTNYPPIPDFSLPSGYITLTTGQTIISLVNGDIEDVRDFLQINNSNLPSPKESGDILLSHNGSDWSRGLPITDVFGEILTDHNGVIITT